MKSRKSSFRKIPLHFRLLFLLLIPIISIRIFFIDFFNVKSNSMLPILQKGDKVIVLKNQGIFFDQFKKNNVIVFRIPNSNHTLIKRIFAGPGDKIEFKGRSIYTGDSEITCSEELIPGTYSTIIIPKKGNNFPLNPHTLPWVKNIIINDGRTISTKNDIIFIDGLASNYYTIKSDCYFVVGDNVNNSIDSRDYGFISKDQVIGFPLLIYWSEDNSRICEGID